MQAEGCKSHEWKELIPVMFVHTIIPNKTQWLFSNAAFFKSSATVAFPDQGSGTDPEALGLALLVVAFPDQGSGTDPEALGLALIVVAFPDQGSGTDPEAWGLIIMHTVKLLQTWYIKMGNSGHLQPKLAPVAIISQTLTN